MNQTTDKDLALAFSVLFGAFAGVYSFLFACIVGAALGMGAVFPTMAAVGIVAGSRMYRYLRSRQEQGETWLPTPRMTIPQASAAREEVSGYTPEVAVHNGGPTDRELSAKARRIRAKCNRLRREASRAGGVYSSLTSQAMDLADQAERLARMVSELRRLDREIGERDPGEPTLPDSIAAGGPDDELQREVQAAHHAQERLEALIEDNQRRVLACIAQMARIEDLVDTARLEVLTPQLPDSTGTGRDIAQQVEMEMQAAREALDEVREQEQELEA